MRTGTLGPTLRRLRGARTVDQVARDAGLDPGVLRSIEAGRLVPTIETLRAVCSALELNQLARLEVQRAREATVATLRANPWARAHRRAS